MTVICLILGWLSLVWSAAYLVDAALKCSVHDTDNMHRNGYQSAAWAIAAALFFIAAK